MHPINKRRSTNQFLLTGTTVDQLGRVAAGIAREFLGWHLIAIGQDSEELDGDGHLFGARISKRGQGIVDIQVELSFDDIRVTKAHWVQVWCESGHDCEPITDIEKALAHERA